MILEFEPNLDIIMMYVRTENKIPSFQPWRDTQTHGQTDSTEKLLPACADDKSPRGVFKCTQLYDLITTQVLNGSYPGYNLQHPVRINPVYVCFKWRLTGSNQTLNEWAEIDSSQGGYAQAVCLSLSYGFKLSFKKSWFFLGFRLFIWKIMNIWIHICVKHRKLWYIYEIIAKNAEEREHLPLKNVPFANLIKMKIFIIFQINNRKPQKSHLLKLSLKLRNRLRLKVTHLKEGRLRKLHVDWRYQFYVEIQR